MRSVYSAEIEDLFLYSRILRTHFDFFEGNFDYMSSVAGKETILFSITSQSSVFELILEAVAAHRPFQ